MDGSSTLTKTDEICLSIQPRLGFPAQLGKNTCVGAGAGHNGGGLPVPDAQGGCSKAKEDRDGDGDTLNAGGPGHKAHKSNHKPQALACFHLQ